MHSTATDQPWMFRSFVWWYFVLLGSKKIQLSMCAVVCTVYPKKYAHGFCFAVLCYGYTLTDFPISIRLTSLALWQSNDCPSASQVTLMNMDKYFMGIHYERLHNHNKAKHNKTVCIFLGIYCKFPLRIKTHLHASYKAQQRTNFIHNSWHAIFVQIVVKVYKRFTFYGAAILYNKDLGLLLAPYNAYTSITEPAYIVWVDLLKWLGRLQK